MKKLLYITLLISSLYSCSSGDAPKRPEPPKEISKYFIKSFFSLNDCKIVIKENKRYDILALGFNTDDKLDIKAPDPKYYELCDHYGDNNYNKTINDLYSLNYAVAEEILSLDIVCDIDFDDKHPAGKSLNDITMFYSMNYYQFIKSGYKNYEYKRGDLPEWVDGLMMPGCYPTMKILSEITPEDLLLLRPVGTSLQFTKPRPEGKQTYTITLKTKDKTFENTVTIE